MDPSLFKLLHTTLKIGLAANFSYLFGSANEWKTNRRKFASMENLDKAEVIKD